MNGPADPSEPPNDPVLRERFHELRAHDAARTPAFDHLRARPRPRPARAAFAGAATALALAAGLVLFLGTSKRSASTAVPPAKPSFAVVHLEPAPLDFLLAPPSAELFGQPPEFDPAPIPKEPRR
jgi:hypothetical protein